MIEETGRVASLEVGFAWVESERQSSCGSCAANKGCGTATLQKVMGNKYTRVKAINPISLQVGDLVVIGIQEQALLKGSFFAYIMPLILLLLGALLFEILFASEGMIIFGGLLGLILGFVFLKYLSSKIATDERYQAVVLRLACTESPIKMIP